MIVAAALVGAALGASLVCALWAYADHRHPTGLSEDSVDRVAKAVSRQIDADHLFDELAEDDR